MTLAACIRTTKIDPDDVADIRSLVRANKGDEAAGIKQYLEGLENDLDGVREELAAQGFGPKPQKLFQFAGPSAATAPSTYEEAIVRLADGENPDVVWKELGWFKGADGRLRFEVSDDGAAINSQWAGKPIPAVSKANPYPVLLKDVLSHDALYDAYPILKTIRIRTSRDLARDGIIAGVREELRGPEIIFDENIWATGKRPDGTDIDVLVVLLHEIQHLIQGREGFASGTDLRNGRDAYRANAGENEARATEARAGLTATERRDAFPIDATVGDTSTTMVIQERVTVEDARGIVDALREQTRQDAIDEQFKAFAAKHATAFGEIWNEGSDEHFLFYAARDILLNDGADNWQADVVAFVRERAAQGFGGQRAGVLSSGDGRATLEGQNGGPDGQRLYQSKVPDGEGVRGAPRGRATFRGRVAAVRAVAGGDRPVYEVEDAELFRDLINEAKTDLGPIGAQVAAYEDYAGKRLFLFDDGYSGFALDGDDIISVFSTPGQAPSGAALRVLEIAVAEGGRRLDGFGTFLPKIYARGGFRAVGKLAFDLETAPDGWDYEFFASEFPETVGEPDVVFMVYDPENASPETDNVVEKYDDGVAAQRAALEEIGPQTFFQPAYHGSPHIFDKFRLDDDTIGTGEGDQSLEQVNRGSITFPAGGPQNGETIIRLFETANLSTFLHESGHFFLAVSRTLADRPDAPAAMKADMAAVLDWLGNKGEPFTTPQQEQWARAFEAYLLEGKAPSLELADAFSRFKAWLTQWYKTITGLSREAGFEVKLTPEIREVMDRMLATEAEIAAARKEAGMSPLFADAASAGMSDAAFAPYQRMARRSAEEAEQRLLAKTMAKVRREREAWYREERDAVRAEVTASVDRRPEYRLIEAMANQRRREGEELLDMPDARLDRDALIERYGEGIIAALGRKVVGGKRAIYGGAMSVDQAAEYFGFRDGDAMILALMNTQKRKDAIAAETDRIMLERHGDPLNDGSIEEEALLAVHSDQQAKTVAAEARQLAKRAGKPTRNITARIFRQRARQMLGRMTVRAATRPAAFLKAGRKAARAAEREFAKIAATATGGRADTVEALAAAHRFKEQELLNHYLYVEARDLEAQVKRGREKMRRYAKPSVRKELAGDYIEQIDALLEDYEFRVASQRTLDRRVDLAGYVDQMTADGREAELAIDQRLIDEARKVHYTRMTVDELQGLFDTIENIDHMGRFKQKLIDAKRTRELNTSVDRVVGQIETNIGTGRADRNEGAAAKAHGALNLLRRVSTMAIEYDGDQLVGVFHEEIKSGVELGSDEEQRMSVELAKKMEELYSVYTAAEIADFGTKRMIAGGNGASWSKSEVLAAAQNMGAIDNQERMFSESAYGNKRVTREQMDAILDTLDRRDWDFVQAQWHLINSYWPLLSEVEYRRSGVRPQKVEAVPVVTKFGTYEGGYYPIAFDPTVPGAAILDKESAFDRYTSAGHGARAAVRNGMTKARQKTGGGRTLKYDLQVPIVHLRDTIRLITLSEAVDNTNRILNDSRVRDAFLDAGRLDDWQVLNLWLRDVAEGPIFNRDFANTVARTIKNHFSLAKLAFNLKTVALQVTGLGHSAVVVGKRNMLTTYIDYGRRHSAMIEEAVAKSPFMAERRSTFQKDIHDFANDVKVSSPISSRYSKGLSFNAKLGIWPIGWSQFYIVDVPTWIAGYRAGLEKFGTEEKAIAFARQAVELSQGSSVFPDRSGFERGTLNKNTRQSDMVRIWSTLSQYMITKLNLALIVKDRTVRGLRKAETPGEAMAVGLSAAVDLFLIYVFESIVMGLAQSIMADDDDEEDGSFARFVLAESGSSLVGGIPFLREVVGGARGFNAGGVFGSVFAAGGALYNQALQGENDKGFRRALADVIGVGTGLPTTQSMRVIEGMIDDETPVSEMMFGRNPMVGR